MKTKIFVLALIAVLIFSCSNSSDPSSSKEIVPLSVGNSWIYKLTLYDSLGNIDEKGRRYDTIAVIGEYEIFDEKWYYYAEDGIYFRNSPKGYHLYYGSATYFHQIYKYPGEVDETFSSVRGGEVYIDSINSEVNVEAGLFTCYKYIENYSNRKFPVYYVCPGVGVIKRVQYGATYNMSQYISSTYELVQYKLN